MSDQATLAIGEIELLGDVNKLLRAGEMPKTSERTREGFVVTPFWPLLEPMVVMRASAVRRTAEAKTSQPASTS